jgi:hypothetical protein
VPLLIYYHTRLSAFIQLGRNVFLKKLIYYHTRLSAFIQLGRNVFRKKPLATTPAIRKVALLRRRQWQG